MLRYIIFRKYGILASGRILLFGCFCTVMKYVFGCTCSLRAVIQKCTGSRFSATFQLNRRYHNIVMYPHPPPHSENSRFPRNVCFLGWETKSGEFASDERQQDDQVKNANDASRAADTIFSKCENLSGVEFLKMKTVLNYIRTAECVYLYTNNRNRNN